MVTKRLSILLIEDDEDDYLIIKNLFGRIRDLQCDIHWISSYHEALEYIATSDQNVYLIDYRLGDGNGLDLLRKVREDDCIKPIIILTGQGDLDVDMEAMEAGASDYLVKGELNTQTLERSIRYALNISETIDTLWRARNELSLEVEERKKAEAELIKAKKSAENASRIKSEFLSNVSHEIRTPMCSIIGMSELLSESKLSKEQEVYVKTTMQAGKELLYLIDEIINISKIESEQIVLEEFPFEFDDLPLKMASIFEKNAQEKGLQFTCHVASDVPAKLIGDPANLEQILTHIISNAIKFTEQGEVLLNVRLASRNKENEKTLNSKCITSESYMGEVEECYIEFSVVDTGVGIPKQKQQLIFDSFSQADASNTREYSGVGLGVTISKRLIEMMGGEVWIESEEGKGTGFYFDVRLWQQTNDSISRSIEEIDLNNIKVLVIDDSKTYQSIVKHELNQRGASVVQAQSCADGIEALEASESSKNFDVLVIDYLLPDMNAAKFIESIRLQYVGSDVPVLLLGAYCKYFDGAYVIDFDSVTCIKKPVRVSELILEIKKAIS